MKAEDEGLSPSTPSHSSPSQVTTCQEPAETRLLKQSCSSLLPAAKESKILSSVPFFPPHVFMEGKNCTTASPLQGGSPTWRNMHPQRSDAFMSDESSPKHGAEAVNAGASRANVKHTHTLLQQRRRKIEDPQQTQTVAQSYHNSSGKQTKKTPSCFLLLGCNTQPMNPFVNVIWGCKRQSPHGFQQVYSWAGQPQGLTWALKPMRHQKMRSLCQQLLLHILQPPPSSSNASAIPDSQGCLR